MVLSGVVSFVLFKLIDIVISGAVTGAIYAVMAAGLVLTYQTAGIFNFAHGEFYMLGAFLTFGACHFLQLNFFLAEAHADFRPTPLLSALMEGPRATGMDVTIEDIIARIGLHRGDVFSS